jgi:hypothetical protein
MNRHGSWDYYNFTKKSYREISIDKEFFRGDKNDYSYYVQKYESSRISSTFSTAAKQSIKANSDWVNDEEAIWLEELFTSPDVYMLGSEDLSDAGNPAPETNRGYVTPVQVVSKKYERYSRANDKVAQYEIDIEIDGLVNVQKNQKGFNNFG